MYVYILILNVCNNDIYNDYGDIMIYTMTTYMDYNAEICNVLHTLTTKPRFYVH